MPKLKNLIQGYMDDEYLGLFITEKRDRIFFYPYMQEEDFYPIKIMKFSDGTDLEFNGINADDNLSHLEGIAELANSIIGEVQFMKAATEDGHEFYYVELDNCPMPKLVFDLKGDIKPSEIADCGNKAVQEYISTMKSSFKDRELFIEELIGNSDNINTQINAMLKSGEEMSRQELEYYYNGVHVDINRLTEDRRKYCVFRNKLMDIGTLGITYRHKRKYNEIAAQNYLIWKVLDNIFETQSDMLKLDIDFMRRSGYEEKADKLSDVANALYDFSSKAYRIKERYEKVWKKFTSTMQGLDYRFMYSQEEIDRFYDTIIRVPERQDFKLTFVPD